MIRFTAAGTVGTVTLDRPPVNAIDPAFVTAFHEALDAAWNAAPTVLVIRSTQKCFCAGADLSLIAGFFDAPDGIALMEDYVRSLHALFDRLEAFPAVTLAVIDGPALGGTQRLTRLCGPGVSARLILGGEVVDVDEAERLGIVQWAVEADALGAFVADTAVRAGGLSRQALLASKDCIAAWHDPQIDGFAREIEKPRELMPTQEARGRVLGFFRRKAG
ncbi:MAG: enoyl-CoA hydratase/isomerase family protein [Bauldia sp.]|nr:MAG: enoyl-CoA hydratase/isomerase family protein [Bauldia sp.]